MTKKIILTLEVEQNQELNKNLMEYIKSSEEVISLQEYIRRILAAQDNQLNNGAK